MARWLLLAFWTGAVAGGMGVMGALLAMGIVKAS